MVAWSSTSTATMGGDAVLGTFPAGGSVAFQIDGLPPSEATFTLELRYHGAGMPDVKVRRRCGLNTSC